MTELSQGDIVVIAHPFLHDTHVIARIAQPPRAATAHVDYWNARTGEFRDDPKRRNRSAIVGKLNCSPELAMAKLSSADAELAASRKRADASYNRAVQALVEAA